MQYIIGHSIEVPSNNRRYASMGFEPNKVYRIHNIRFNRETKNIEYYFDGPLNMAFKSTTEADAFFDRIRGVTREPADAPDLYNELP